MSSKLIKVRAVPGRIAYTAARGGKLIPSDGDGINVERTAWIERLIRVHGDIEVVEPVKAKAKDPAANSEQK